MKRKLLVMLLTGAILSTVLTGCGTGQSAEENKAAQTQSSTSDENAVELEESGDGAQAAELESGKVELTIWAEEDNFEMLQQMIDSFKEQYAGQADFDISLVAQQESNTKDMLLGDIHNGADVFSFADDQMLSMVAGGALSPVENAESVKTANLEESVAAATYNDVLYAYPYTADNGYFLYYDKNYLTEQDVQTLDGILTAAQNSGKQFYMEFDSGWYLYSFFGGTGLEVGLNEDGVTNYCNWNATDGAIKGADVAQSLMDITASPAFCYKEYESFVDGIQSGNVVAGISGVWNAVAVQETWGADYGACKLPTYTCAGQQVQMASFTGYKMMGVNAYSKHVGWAHKLAEWITNEENQTLRFEMKNQGPSNINAASSDVVRQVPAIKAVIEQSEYGTLQRIGNPYWEPCVSFGENILAGNPEGKTPQELMDILVEGITASTVQ